MTRYLNAHSQAPQNLQKVSSLRAATSRSRPTCECRKGMPGAASVSACGPVSRLKRPTILSLQASGFARLSWIRIISKTLAEPKGYSGSSSGRGIRAFSDISFGCAPAGDNHDISVKGLEPVHHHLFCDSLATHFRISPIQFGARQCCVAESVRCPSPSDSRRTARACSLVLPDMRATSSHLRAPDERPRPFSRNPCTDMDRADVNNGRLRGSKFPHSLAGSDASLSQRSRIIRVAGVPVSPSRLISSAWSKMLSSMSREICRRAAMDNSAAPKHPSAATCADAGTRAGRGSLALGTAATTLSAGRLFRSSLITASERVAAHG